MGDRHIYLIANDRSHLKICIKTNFLYFQVKVKSLQESLAEAEGALDEMDDLRRKLKEAKEELERNQ